MNHDYMYAIESCEKMQKKIEKNLPKLTTMEVRTNFEHLMFTVKKFLTLAGWRNLLGICVGTKF